MIQMEAHGRVTVLTIAHGKANALDLELCRDIERCLGESEAEGNALVVTGGGKVFSAGVDLLRVLDGGTAYVGEFLPALARALGSLFAYPGPLVAAVNGHAVAGGCMVACAADHRIMAEGTGRIGVPELRVGVPFPIIALEMVRFASAPSHLQRLLYGGATLLPGEALEAGLVDEVVPADQLLARALATAERLADIPAPLFSLTKRQLRRPVWERAMQAEGDYEERVRELWHAPETLSAIRQYVAVTLRK